MTAEIFLGVGELAMAGAVALAVSLRFAQWVLKRQDKRDAEALATIHTAELAPEVRQRRIDALLKRRELHEERIALCVRRADDASADRAMVDSIDRELSTLLESPS